MSKSGIDGFSFAMKDFLAEVAVETLAARERGLDKAGAELINDLENHTPPKTGKTAKSWVLTTKYQGVRYANNTSLNANRIPIVNMLEYGRRGKPFVRKTYNSNIEKYNNIIIGELQK